MRAGCDTAWIEERAKTLGFALCGVVRAARFPELAQTEEWLARGYAGEMKYLSDARRSNPESVMPGIRSVIVCALNYNTEQPKSTDPADGSNGPNGSNGPARYNEEPRGWISRYARGSDYHDVLRK